ncbi:hypothetical protein PR003_g4965 [Phytophthora rubi]|nr:hypothetical protein PR003_g4965 [Phytophthora rubi]
MFFIFTGIVDVLLPSRIANRPKTTFKAVANVLINRKEDGDSAPSQVGPVMTDIGKSWQQSRAQEEMKKVAEISAGSYFGENALFTDGQRDAYILAQTSCILYRLSRESLELVFDRYPKWKQKVLRIANINREQARLLRLSREEQRRGMITASGKVLSRSDIVNERAESLKQKRSHTPLQYSDNASYKHTSVKLMRILNRFVFKPLLKLFDGFIHGVAVQSNFHLFWVRFIVWCTTYVAIMVPYELTMDSMNRKTVAAAFVNTGGLLCQAAFILDVWFSWHVHGSPESMELYDQKLRSVYMRERIVWDILAAIPFYDFLSVYDCSSWFKLLRCIKFFNLGSYLAELNRRSVATEATRFWHVWMIYLLVIYWAACAYLAVSMEVGFGEEWEGWLPSQELVITDPKNASSEQLTLRLLRGLFFAMVAFVKKAYCPEPETAPIYAFHIGMSFVGLIVMSYVIGELASLFISYIGLEVNYRKNFIAVELYVTRLRLTERLKARTYVFMTSFWSSHAGVNYEDLLAEMPRDIRTACVLHVSKKPLTWFIMKVVTPICWEGGHSIDALTRSLAERLRFESYPRDEHVVTEGSIVRAMYFVMKGHLNMHSRLLLDHPVGLRSGGYFGERGLLGCSVSAYTVHTVRACDLLSLSSEAFAQVLQEHPFSRLALKICDRAYKYLKGQHLASCSRNDMEEHWGEALLLALQAVGTKTQPAPSSILESTEKPAHVEETASSTEITAISSFRIDTAASPDKITETERSFQRKNSVSSSATVEDSQAVHNTHSEFEELSAHLSTMSKALNTAHGCFEAFAPLLHIMLSTDPLEWNASFNSPSVTTQPNALDTRVKATYTRRGSSFTTEQGKPVPFISHNDGDGHFDAH